MNGLENDITHSDRQHASGDRYHPKSTRRQGDGREKIADANDLFWLEPTARGELREMLGKARAFVKLGNDKRLIGQLRKLDALVRECVVRGQSEQHGFGVHDRGGDAVWIVAPGPEKADIDQPVAECGQLGGGFHGSYLNLDL